MFSQESLELGFEFRKTFKTNKIKALSDFKISLSEKGLELVGENGSYINSLKWNLGIKNLCSYFFTQREEFKKEEQEKYLRENSYVETINEISKKIKYLRSLKISRNNDSFLIKNFEVAEEFNKQFIYVPETLLKNSRSRNCDVRRGLIKPSLAKEETLIPEYLKIDDGESDKGNVLTEVDYLKVDGEFLEYEVESKEYLPSGARLTIVGAYNIPDYVSEIIIEDYSLYKSAIESIEINGTELEETNFVSLDYGNIKTIFFKKAINVSNFKLKFRQLKPIKKEYENRDLYADALGYKTLERYPYSHKKNYVYNFSFRNISFIKKTPRTLSCIEFKEKISLIKESVKIEIKELTGNEINISGWLKVTYKEENEAIKSKVFKAEIGTELSIGIDEHYDTAEGKLLFVIKEKQSYPPSQYLISKVEII